MNLLLLAAIYGTLSAGQFLQAPYVSVYGLVARVTSSLSERQANRLGYRLLVDEKPVCCSNEQAVATGYVENAVIPEGQSNAVVRIFRTYEKQIPTPAPRRWTPLSIKRAALQLGKWADVKAFLVAADAYDDFCMAQYEAEDDPQFITLLAALRAQYGDALVDAILNSAETE